MKKYFDVLRKCSLFNEIEDDSLLTMLDCIGAKIRHFDKRETVIAEGEQARYIGIVLSGAVQIEQTDYFGNRTIVGMAVPSELFGESFACAEARSMPVGVIASDEADIMFVDCERITHPCCNACSFHSQIIYNLMKIVAVKNLAFHQKIEIISKRTTREKLMTFLMIQAKKNNSSSFSVHFDRQALADYLGVDRSGLSAEISKLQKEGIIKSKKNYFEIVYSETT